MRLRTVDLDRSHSDSISNATPLYLEFRVGLVSTFRPPLRSTPCRAACPSLPCNLNKRDGAISPDSFVLPGDEPHGYRRHYANRLRGPSKLAINGSKIINQTFDLRSSE